MTLLNLTKDLQLTSEAVRVVIHWDVQITPQIFLDAFRTLASFTTCCQKTDVKHFP